MSCGSIGERNEDGGRMKCPNCKIDLHEVDIGKPTQRLICSYCPFNAAPNTKQIDEFYCWLSVDESGMEGMVGVSRNGTYMVAQNSNKAVAEHLRPDMKEAAKQTGMKMRLVKFVKTEVIEEIK